MCYTPFGKKTTLDKDGNIILNFNILISYFVFVNYFI
jgi:hypothetical protein